MQYLYIIIIYSNILYVCSHVHTHFNILQNLTSELNCLRKELQHEKEVCNVKFIYQFSLLLFYLDKECFNN